MRLWHIDLIPYLPKSQLLAQWRELNSIFKKQDKHILINYIYGYPKSKLDIYAKFVMKEMYDRGYKFNITNYVNYFFGKNCIVEQIEDDLKYEFWDEDLGYLNPFKEHNNEYLTICYWNLREKYLRGQKDFTKEVWEKLDKFYKKQMEE